MRLLVIGLTALLLAACGSPAEKASSSGAYGDEKAPVLGAELMKPVAPQPGGGTASGPPPAQTPAPNAPMLAYIYTYGIEAPLGKIRGLVSGHEAACAAAGPTQCQVTSSTLRELDGSSLVGRLELRASADWVKRFRDGLPGEAKAAGGKVTNSEVSSEDLSRQIVDTEARVRAMTTLRDRLMALLAERPGKLADVVEIERELARVQGEIDSTASQLAVMRGRVQMSILTIDYNSKGLMAPQSVWSPLTGAFKDVLGIIVFTLGVIVRLAAWSAPWLALGAGVLWLFRKRLRARWSRKPPPEAS